MRYQKLGNTDIDVSVVALGTWGLGGGSVWSDRDSTAEEAARLLDACRDHGINYIDTAPVYGTGVSEELLGRALKGGRTLCCRPSAPSTGAARAAISTTPVMATPSTTIPAPTR